MPKISDVNVKDSAVKAAVVGWLTSYDCHQGDEDNVKCALEDLLRGGCINGMVSNLCNYSETTAFFEEHKEEINEMLKDNFEICGFEGSIFNCDRFDTEDFLCLETTNQNLLAWWAFEEKAYEVYSEMYEQED